MKWISNVSKRNLSASDFEYEYMYLYTDYCEQYKIHKLESKMSKLEILFVGVIDIIGRNELPTLGSLLSSYISYRKQGIMLSKAEVSFSGRELAYIHKANEVFANPF
jgi:hypothetical protein